jgi:RHS repeat-associated protein
MTHDGTERAAFAYTYNAADQLVSQTDTGDLTASHSYDYDTHGRLAADGTDVFGYDDAGNLTSLHGATLSHDAADRLTTSTYTGDTTAFAYNATGDRTQTTPPTGPATGYGYDQADQLTSVDDHTATPITYTYAADGLRATKTKNSATTHFTWDRTSSTPVLLAKDSTRYVYDQAGLALEQIDSDGTVSYLHHDRLGNTRLVTNADGSTQATYTYDAHGNRTTTGSSSVPFGYTGQYTDTDTGLIYLRHRYYDLATGQFLTRDPLEVISGSAYSYAGGDPANFVDPSGLLLGIPGTPSWSSVVDSVGFVAHTLNLNCMAVPNSRFLTGIGNAAYGATKVVGGAVLVAFGTAADVTGVGAVIGVSVELAGVYEIGTGAARIARGGKQFVSATRRPIVHQTPARYLQQLALDLVPGRSIVDGIGGLP